MTPDPHWLEAHADALNLHIEKGSRYGLPTDPLANFILLGEITGDAPERYAYERIIEKAQRALHMIDAHEAAAVEEGLDIATLALNAEALRRRQHPQGGSDA